MLGIKLDPSGLSGIVKLAKAMNCKGLKGFKTWVPFLFKAFFKISRFEQ